MIESVELVGGTSCIVDTTAATEVAAVGVWYGRGSRDEGDTEKGSTHFIEHMLFKGTRKRDAFRIAREIDRLGGTINAFTERESVSVFAVVPSDAFERTAEIIVDMTEDALFDKIEFERERTVIENELSAAEDDPEEVATDAFAQLMWKDHPLGRKIGGTIDDVKKLDRDAVYSTFKSKYAEAADVVTVAGDVDPERARRTFNGAFRKSKQKPDRDAPVWPAVAGAYYEKASFQHVQVFCSFQLPRTIPNREYYALQVANTAMGDSMSSRLFQALRERSGLCYSIYSAPTLLSDVSLWTIYASSTPETIPQLIDGISDELNSFLNSSGFDDEEFNDAKAQLRGGMKLESMDIEHRMRRIARQTLYGNEPFSIAQASDLIGSVNNTEVDGALFGFLRGSKPLLFAAGPAGAKSRFMASAEKLLKKIGGNDVQH